MCKSTVQKYTPSTRTLHRYCYCITVRKITFTLAETFQCIHRIRDALGRQCAAPSPHLAMYSEYIYYYYCQIISILYNRFAPGRPHYRPELYKTLTTHAVNIDAQHNMQRLHTQCDPIQAYRRYNLYPVVAIETRRASADSGQARAATARPPTPVRCIPRLHQNTQNTNTNNTTTRSNR